jgi:Cu+-exporting ATPase
MNAAAAGIATGVQDPVCGMEIDAGKARAAGRVATYRGRSFCFCSDDCKQRFAREPQKYAGENAKN